MIDKLNVSQHERTLNQPLLRILARISATPALNGDHGVAPPDITENNISAFPWKRMKRPLWRSAEGHVNGAQLARNAVDMVVSRRPKQAHLAPFSGRILASRRLAGCLLTHFKLFAADGSIVAHLQGKCGDAWSSCQEFEVDMVWNVNASASRAQTKCSRRPIKCTRKPTAYTHENVDILISVLHSCQNAHGATWASRWPVTNRWRPKFPVTQCLLGASVVKQMAVGSRHNIAAIMRGMRESIEASVLRVYSALFLVMMVSKCQMLL